MVNEHYRTFFLKNGLYDNIFPTTLIEQVSHHSKI